MVLPHALRHVTFLIVSSAVFLVTLSVSSSADDKLKVDLATIQRSWTEWRKSFATIRIVGREWDQASVFQYNPDVDQSKDEWREKFYSRDEFTWSDIGAFKHDRVHHKTGMANSRNAMGSDGANPWSASAPVGGDLNRWDGLMIYRPLTDRPLKTNLIIPYIWGLWNCTGFWFDEFVARGEPPIVVQTEDVDGVACVVVKKPFENRREFTYWLDPNHSYLPRKCLERGPKGDEIGIYKTWTVIEFQRVDGHFWFPKRTNMVFPSHPLPGFEMAIDEVILNEPLPRSSFGPPVPSPGTRVTDYQNMKAARIAGGPEAVPSPAPQQTSNGAGNIRANVPISSWTRWGLLGGALLMLGVAVRWWQRSYS